MTPAPILSMVWDGEAMRPASPFHLRRARDAYGEGECVDLTEADGQRSSKSHAHFFATITEMWRTLPESLAAAPYAASAESLRKHALIATGFCDVQTVTCGTKAEADRWAKLSSGYATAAHGYAIVDARGTVVKIMTPESQSYRAMGKTRFQESKTAVLDWIGALLEGRTAA